MKRNRDPSSFAADGFVPLARKGTCPTLKRDYDPKLDATAKEVRAEGCVVDSSVPNDAWIPRAAFARPPLAIKGEERPLQTSFAPAPPFEWQVPNVLRYQ